MFVYVLNGYIIECLYIFRVTYHNGVSYRQIQPLHPVLWMGTHCIR